MKGMLGGMMGSRSPINPRNKPPQITTMGTVVRVVISIINVTISIFSFCWRCKA